MGKKGTHRCICCGGFVDENEMYHREEGWLCDRCESDDYCEPEATVIYGGEEEEPRTIGMYHNETDGDFTTEWVSTDPWRGYIKVSSEKYVDVADDCILSYSEDARELENMDKEIRRICDELGLRYARVFSRTSNVFSAGYDFFVHRDDVDALNGEIEKLKEKYRDPARFVRTALFGA